MMMLMAKAKPKTPATRTGKAVNVWIPDELHTALKEFMESQRVAPRITDVVELSLQEFLQREGYYGKKSA